MKPVCEVIVREVLPAVRSILAKELLDAGLTQKEVAHELGLTQPAVSQYVKRARGKNAMILRRNKEVAGILKHVVSDIANKRGGGDQFFCSICHKIKRTGAVCRFHAVKGGTCTVCMTEVCK